MRINRFHAFLLGCLILGLLGPSLALSQQGGGRKGGGKNRGQWGGGGGGFQWGGGKGGKGGFGGGKGGGFKFDSDTFFNKLSNGKDVITVSELAESPWDPKQKENMNAFLTKKGVTTGQMSRALYKEFLEERMAQFRNGGGWGKKGGDKGGGGGGAPAADPKLDAEAEAAFKKADRNGDNVLSPDEMPAELKAALGQWDTNKNGVIELNEFKAYYRDLKSKQQVVGAITGVNPESPEDARPAVYTAGKLPKDIPPWFAQLDNDQDGQVGLYEWKSAGKSVDEFIKMDLNGDGFLTCEEVLRYQKLIKANPDLAKPGGGAAPTFQGGGNRRGNRGG
jgi:hypothetical protein